MPLPPRKKPGPPESGTVSYDSMRSGKYASRNSFGTLVNDGQSECPSGPSPNGRPGMPPKPIW